MRYTPRGGTILLRTLRQTDGAGMSHALLQVIDTGVGIAAGDLPRIFERSFRGEVSRRGLAAARAGVAGRRCARELLEWLGVGLAIARDCRDA